MRAGPAPASSVRTTYTDYMQSGGLAAALVAAGADQSRAAAQAKKLAAARKVRARPPLPACAHTQPPAG